MLWKLLVIVLRSGFAIVIALQYTSVGSFSASPSLLYGQQEDEQSYYASSYAIVDLPLREIISDLPELEGLEPAPDQQQLPELLAKTGESVTDAYESLVNVAADEEIVQEQYGYKSKVSEESRHRFGYLITVEKEPAREVLHEYRTDDRLKPVETPGTAEAFPLTSNFSSMWVLFYPQNQSLTRFRYLGEQRADGKTLAVIAFAERPGNAVVTGRINFQRESVLVLYQGVAWVDRDNFRIAKMRLDLLQPRLDIGLERMTTEIQFGQVRIPAARAALWLPQKVTVTAMSSGQLYRNRHSYSNFKLFTAQTAIQPARQEQAPP